MAKEIEARKAAAVAARQVLAVKADRTKLEAAQAELDGRATAYKTMPSADALAAADKAAGELEAALKGSAELAAKDKAHGAFVATLTKKLADQRAGLLGTKNEQSIAAHKAEVAAAKTKVADTLTALKGKLDYESYAEAAKVTEAYGKTIAAGESLGATNARYAAELATAKAGIVGLEMQARRTWIEAADAAAKARIEALKDKPDAAAFTEAEKAVKTLATTAESSKPAAFTDKTYLAFVAASEKQAVAYKAQIDQRRVSLRIDGLKSGVESVATAAAEAVKALDGEPAPAAFDKAEAAVKELERALEPDSELGTSQPAYLAEQKKNVVEHRARITARRIEVVAGAHRKLLVAAGAELTDKLKALSGAGATPEALTAAEGAATALDKVTESAGPAVEVDAKYGKDVAAAKARVAPARAEIEKRRTEVAVAAHKADVDAAVAAQNAKMAAIAKGDAAALDAAAAGADELEGVLEEGASVGAKDAKHAAILAALTKKLEEQRAAIARGRTGLEVGAHRATVEAEKAKVTAALAELTGKTEEAPYQAAEKAVGGYASALGAGEKAAEKDEKYAAELKAKVAEIPGLRMQIQKKRIDAAAAALAETMKAPGEVAASEDALEKLSDAIEKARGFKTEDKAYAATLAAADKGAAAQRAAIDKRKVDAEVATHREKAKAAVAALSAQAAELAKAPDGAGAVEKAATAADKVVGEGKSAAAKSPAYEKELAAFTQAIEKARAAAAGAKVELEVAEHKKKVEAAVAEVQAKLGALGKLEYELFASAETAVAGLEKVLSSGDELASSRPAYGKELATARGKVEGYRITIRSKWIEAADLAVQEKLKGLEGKPNDKAFKAADDAVIVLGRTIESGKTLTQAAPYQKTLAAADKQALGYRAKIDQRRVDVVVDVHRAELDAAEKAANDAMAALGGKGAKLEVQPDDKAFKAAQSAVRELLSTVESGDSAGEKDPAYGKRLAALKAKAPGLESAIEARRIEVEVANHKAGLDAAVKKVNEELATVAKGTAFTGAEQAIEALESAIEGGKSAGDKSPPYAAALAAEEKKIAGYKARIAQRRTELAVAEQTAELAAAQAAAAEATKSLGDAAAIGAAEEAVGALESQVGEGAELAKQSPAFGGKLAAAKAVVPKHRAAIAAARIGVDAQAHKKAVEMAEAEAVAKVGALAEGTSGSAVKAANKAVDALESSVKAVPELAAKSPAHTKALGAYGKKVTDLRAQIAKREVETEVKAHREKVAAAVSEVGNRLGALGKLEYDLFASAETGVASLEKVLQGAEGLVERDPSYAKELAPIQKGIEGYRITIRTKWIEAAQAVTVEKLAAMDAKPNDKTFKAADDAVVVLNRTIESGQNLTKAPAYQKTLAASAKQAAGYQAQIDKKRVAVVVDVHKAELDKAEATLVTSLGAIAAPKPDDGAFKAAQAAIKDLADTIDSGTDAGTKDPAYAKRLAALKAKLPAHEATVDKRRFEVEVSGNKEKIAAASKALNEKLAALAGEPDDAAFGAAQTATAELESAITEGGSFGRENKAYAAVLAAEQKKVPAARARIEKRRGEVELAEHVGELTEAQTALAAAIKGLAGAPDAAAFKAAEDAVVAVEEQIGEGADYVKAHPAHGKRLAAAKADLPKKRAAVAAARVGLEVAEHNKAIATASAEAEAKVEALGEGVTGSAVKAAEKAVAALESTVEKVPELAQKSPAHTKALGAHAKKASELKKQIAQREVETELKAHREKLAAAVSEVGNRIGALGKLEYDLFAAAETAVAGVEKVLSGAEGLVERDPRYAKELAPIQKSIEGYRITIRTKWIEAADAVVVEKMAALDAKPDDKAFKQAEDAVVVLNRTIESGQNLTKAPAYQKRLAVASKVSDGYRNKIDKRRISLVVDVHKAELDKSEAALAESLGALSGKPDDSAFKAAQAAVKDLEDTIESGTDAGTKDPAYAKRLAALKAKIPAQEATIEKRRFEVEVSGNKEKVAAASKDLTAKLAALGGSPDEGAFSAAESAVGALESALDEGTSFGRENKAYAAALAAEKKKLPAARARIAKRQGEVEVAEHAESLGEAQATLASAIKALAGSNDDAAFKAAEDAIGGVEEQISEGAEYVKAHPAHGRKIAAAKADLPKKRAAIANARLGIELAAHRKEVESAAAEAAQRIEQLGDGVTPSSMKAAEGAVAALEKATDSELADKSTAHAKWLAAYRKKAPALRAQIAKQSIAKELEAHRREVVEAKSAVTERMGALGKLDYDLFAAADGAINDLEKALESGESLGEQDKAYGKALKAELVKIPGLRIAVRKKWIDSAEAAVIEKMAAVDGKADERGFKAAEDAVKVLNNTIESGQSLSKAPPYQKMLAASEKKAAGYYAKIDRLRALSQFAEVRGELDTAVSEASAAMAKASEDPDAASKALSNLADAIDSNAGAADRDPVHKKRLALLRKKLAADKAKVAKLEGAAKSKSELAGVEEAEDTLIEAMAALKKAPDDGAIQGVEEAIDGLESAMEGKTPTGKSKVYFAGLKKKIAVAKVTINKSRGEATVREHKTQLEAQLASTREAMGGLKKMGGREALSAAESAVDTLADLVDSGKALGKANKKYGAYLASARKTAAGYQTAIKKQRALDEKASASRSVPSGSDDEEESEAEDSGADPKVALEASQILARKLMKAATAKNAGEDAISAAKVAIDDLADTIASAAPAAKKDKALGKKLLLAKVQVSKGKKALAKIESAAAAKAARLAKIEAAREAKEAKLAAAREAKEAKAARAAAVASAGDDEEESDTPEGEPSGDPKARLGEAWTSFTQQLPALKSKKATVEQVDAALEAAGEVESALEEVASASVPKTAKYVKYVAGIKKRLKTEKGKLTKRKRALDAQS